MSTPPREPGSSPAYDPFLDDTLPRAPRGEERSRPAAAPPAASQEAEEPPAAPTQHADGSWSVVVDDETDRYPAPRKPFTASVAIAEPTSHDTQPAQEPPPRAPRRRRTGRMLGIGIPAVVLAAAAVVAAVVVPGIVTDQQAEEAAAAFEQQRADWQSTLSADRLDPYSTFSADGVLGALDAVLDGTTITTDAVSVADASELAQACASVDALSEDAGSLTTATPPARPDVDGGESNDRYEQALSVWESEQDAYVSSQALVSDIQVALDDIGGVCDLVLQEHEIVTALSQSADELTAAMAVPLGDVQTVTIDGGGWVEVTCVVAFGCASLDDAAARAEVGDLWDAAFTAAHSSLAELYDDSCPTMTLADACGAAQSTHADAAVLAAAVGEAYGADDPAQDVLSSAGVVQSPTPAFDDALAAYDSGWSEGVASEDDAVLAATGFASFDDALHGTVQAASTTVSQAAAELAST